MLKLYGFIVSHYYNMVKHTLLIKGIPFEEVAVLPGAGPAYLDKSPLGKIPCIETEHGFLSESIVILDYLETCYPQPRLSPSDTWGQVKMKELMQISELYVELPGHRLMPAAQGRVQLEQATLDDAASTLTKGLTAIAKLGQFKPYLMGEHMTLADIVLRYALVVVKSSASLPDMNTAAFVNIDINAIAPRLAAWEQLMGESVVGRDIDAIMVEELPKFIATQQKRAQ